MAFEFFRVNMDSPKIKLWKPAEFSNAEKGPGEPSRRLIEERF